MVAVGRNGWETGGGGYLHAAISYEPQRKAAPPWAEIERALPTKKPRVYTVWGETPGPGEGMRLRGGY